MKELEDKSIDLLITDPPYKISYQSGRRKKKHKYIDNDDNTEWLEPFLVEVKRVLKPDAHAYIFCSHHNVDVFLTSIKKYLPYKNLLIWEKNNHGSGDLKGDYAPKHELIIFCSNGKKKLNGKRTPNILKYRKTGNTLHPTEKPVDLFQFLIEKSSKESDLVLDSFAGSCTASIAAINTNRNWICVEMDATFFNRGLRRIESRLNDI